MSRRGLLAGAVAIALAGCGTATPTTGAFRAGATRVCTRAIAKAGRVPPPATVADTTTFLRRGTAVLRSELAELRALRAPTAQTTAYAAALTADQRELDLLDAVVHDLDLGADPLSAVKTLQRRLSPLEAADAAAWRALDVPACARE
jgi:hypothetical protein